MAADPGLAAILFAEAQKQGLSTREIATKGNLLSPKTGLPSHTRVHEALSGLTDPQFSTVVGILSALGRDLAWLARELKKPE